MKTESPHKRRNLSAWRESRRRRLAYAVAHLKRMIATPAPVEWSECRRRMVEIIRARYVALLLARKLHAAFPMVRGTAGWIADFLARHLRQQRTWADQARHLDDPQERATADLERELPAIARLLANDDPAQARRALTLIRRLIANI